MSRSRMLGAAMAIIVGVLAALAVWTMLRPSDDPESMDSATAPTSTASLTAEAMTQGEADILGAALSSGDSGDIAAVLAKAVQSSYLEGDRELVPRSSIVLVDAATFRLGEGSTGTVEATVSGPRPGSWILIVARESGEWRLVTSLQRP